MIRQLGIELAQSRVDVAYLQARIAKAREAAQALFTGMEGTPDPALMALMAVLSNPVAPTG